MARFAHGRLPTKLLKTGPTGRYLINAAGTPTQLRTDAAWLIPCQLSREQIRFYLSKRKSQGFNAVQCEIIEVADGYSVDGPAAAPANFYGDLPFISNDFTQRNEAYWNHIDYLTIQAGNIGMQCVYAAFYLGANAGQDGWLDEGVAAGTTAVQNYGAFLANRYAKHHNIIWFQGGDYRPNPLTIPDAVAAGMATDTRHLMSTHWARNSSGTDGSPSWLTLNQAYTGSTNVWSRIVSDYQHSPVLPVYHLESYYEGSFSGQPTLTGQDASREAWTAYLAGACGHAYGHHTVWPLNSGWEAALDSNGSVRMSYMHSFFDAIEWWKLVPDINSTFITAGRGTTDTATYVAAASSADGTLAVVHIPNGGQVTAAMSGFASSVNVQAFDPSAGTYTTISGSPFSNSGSQNIDPPGSNDVVLLFKT